MMFSEAIPIFVESRRADGFSFSTCKNYTSILHRAMRIIGDMPLNRITALHVDRIMTAEADRNLAAGTLNLMQSNLSAFFRWCREREYMGPNQNPIGSRRYRKDPPKQKDYIPLSDFPRVLEVAETMANGERSRAFMAAGLYLMVRQSELINIRIKDVNLEYGEIDVLIRKTKDRDIMPICAELHDELVKWLDFYRKECGPLDGDWYLFPAIKTIGFHKFALNPTAQISRSQDLVIRVLEKMGWKEKWVGVHVLRRSAARARLDENMDMGYDAAMREIQSWLHHASITTTERYLQIFPDREKRNRRTAGQLMFPSIAQDKVAKIHTLGESSG